MVLDVAVVVEWEGYCRKAGTQVHSDCVDLGMIVWVDAVVYAEQPEQVFELVHS